MLPAGGERYEAQRILRKKIFCYEAQRLLSGGDGSWGSIEAANANGFVNFEASAKHFEVSETLERHAHIDLPLFSQNPLRCGIGENQAGEASEDEKTIFPF